MMVLLDDNFATIIAAIEEAARSSRTSANLSPIFYQQYPEHCTLSRLCAARYPLPLTIIQILAIDLGTDMLPALALGAERPSGAVMRSPPRPRGQPLLTSAILWRAYAFSAYQRRPLL
jgi:sodium/potassium-transporting ATPase subunit alpha